MLNSRLRISAEVDENGVTVGFKIQYVVSSPMIGEMAENIISVNINTEPLTIRYDIKKLSKLTERAFKILGNKIEKELLNKYFNNKTDES